MSARRAVIAIGSVIGCSAPPTPATQPAVAPSSPSVMMSDPAEYTIDSISRDAGKIIFERSGIGDPYGTGIPYALFLGLQRAYPRILGANPESLSGRFGFVSGTPDPSSADADRREGLPVGMHLTTDPLTGVAFLMTSCAVCHAERVRWPGGDALVIGLGNKRVRIHDYDAAFAQVTTEPKFTASHLGMLAAAAAEERGLVWPEAYREVLTAATIRALDQRATERADLRARTLDNPPGRVATIESFVLVLAQLTKTRIDFPPDHRLGQDSRCDRLRPARHAVVGRER